MLSFTEQTFSIYELTEHILLQLNDHVEIIRAQRVCRTWKDVIQTSPALQDACWYQPYNIRDAQTRSISGQQTQPWKLNPAFNRIGVSISKGTRDEVHLADRIQEEGNFSLEERIYDKPGSWTTMLATQPPCQRMLVECYGDYSHDETMFYLIVSMTGCLLMGDIMAVLAECQNRQECGLDRWGGVRHYTGQLLQWEERHWDAYHWVALDKMPDNVSIKVAVELPWGSGGCPAFSLRRLYGSKHFLREMIFHKMIMDDGHEYQWDHWNHGGFPGKPVCKTEKYKANLLVVREHQEGYMSDYSHIFRLLSDVE
ncbi:hypothetical protein BBP40_002288 [Aspergillus hancockii]|nr:hypothetical protein BBP40_002288 [Aspergillus hancockii]